MYRYYLFQCDTYYPSGGMYDCKLKTNNLEDLIPFINKHYSEVHRILVEKYQDE